MLGLAIPLMLLVSGQNVTASGAIKRATRREIETETAKPYLYGKVRKRGRHDGVRKPLEQN